MQKILKRVVFVLFFSVSCYASLPYVVTDVLPSKLQIEEDVKNFTALVEQKLAQFQAASKQRRYTEAYDAWETVCGKFFSLKLLYGQVISLSPDAAIKMYAEEQFLQMQSMFRQRLQEKQILDTFAANGLAAASLTPFQRDLTERILRAANHQNLQALLPYERQNFATLQLSPNKTPVTIDTLRVLTANILCFPDQLSYFYGGATPWPDRIDKIAAKILSTKATLVCLQEVWDLHAMQALIERLKETYSYFVYDAGCQFGTLDPEEMGFSSALFIASQVPLDSVSFAPFSRVIPAKAGTKRGAVCGTFTLGRTTWTFITTHLQHGTDLTAAEIREEQLQHCIKLLPVHNGFLLGDLNINAFSKEFATSPLSSLFSIPYLQGQSSVTTTNATATDYFNDLTHTPPSKRSTVKPVYELLDYCVVRKGSAEPLSQEKITLFSIEDPSTMLSDHQGLLTVWKIPR